MKFLVLILAVFLTGTNGQRRMVNRIINEISDSITDPIIVEGKTFDFDLPENDTVKIEAGVGRIEVKGLSDIELDSFRFSRSVANFNVVMKEVVITFEDVHATVNVFDREFGLRFSGTITVSGINFGGSVGVNVRDREVRDADIDFTIDDITSDLSVKVMGEDFSDTVNEFLNETLPNALSENSDQINSFIENLILEAAGAQQD